MHGSDDRGRSPAANVLRRGGLGRIWKSDKKLLASFAASVRTVTVPGDPSELHGEPATSREQSHGLSTQKTSRLAPAVDEAF
jgi:hypothetical protein